MALSWNQPLESGLGKGTWQNVRKQVSEDDLTSNMGLWWRWFQDESLPNMPTPESLDPEKILCSEKSTPMKARLITWFSNTELLPGSTGKMGKGAA